MVSEYRPKQPGEWTVEEVLRRHPRHVEMFMWATGLSADAVKKELSILESDGKAHRCEYLPEDWWTK